LRCDKIFYYFFTKGLISIIVEGTRRIGGVNLIYQRVRDGDRLEFFEYFWNYFHFKS